MRLLIKVSDEFDGMPKFSQRLGFGERKLRFESEKFLLLAIKPSDDEDFKEHDRVKSFVLNKIFTFRKLL